MIPRSDTTLSELEYNSLASWSGGDLNFKVELKQYNPYFSTIGSPASRDSTFDSFDANIYDGTLWEVETGELGGSVYLYSTTGTEWAVASSFSATPTLLSLVSDDDGLIVFYSDGSTVRFRTSADGSSWSSATELLSGTIVALAAPSRDRLYVIKSTSKGNYQFVVMENDGGWSLVDLPRIWPFEITSFDSESIGDYDVLIVTTELPPLFGVKLRGQELTKTVNRRRAVLTFRYRGGMLSEPYVVSVNDTDDGFSDCKLSYFDDMLYASFYVDEFSSLCVTRSKDGKHWENLEFKNAISPAKVLLGDDYAYLVNPHQCKRSDRTIYFGGDPTGLDVTDNVLTLKFQSSDVQTVTLSLTDTTDTIKDFISGKTVWAEVSYGYPSLVQVFSGIMDNSSMSKTIARSFSLPVSDLLRRSKTILSPSTNELENPVISRDWYESSDGGDYSGLRHTAPAKGGWRAPANNLVLKSNNDDAVACSTYASYSMNISVSAKMKYNDADEGDYCGLCIRTYDADNLLGARYNSDTSKIELIQRSSGSDAVLASTAATWASDTFKYLRLSGWGAVVWVELSDDGISWSTVITYELSSITEWTFESLPPLSGKAGVIGRAYAPEVTYDYPDYDCSDGYETDYEVDYPYDQDEDWAATVWAITQRSGAFYSADFTGPPTEENPSPGDPTWSQVIDGLPTGYLGYQGAYDPTDSNDYFILLNGECSVHDYDLYVHHAGEGNSWESLITNSQAQAAVVSAGGAGDGHLAWFTVDKVLGTYYAFFLGTLTVDKIWCLKSSDHGSSWSAYPITANLYSRTVGPAYAYNGVVQVSLDYRANSGGRIAYSLDGGMTWTVPSRLAGGSWTPPLYVPSGQSGIAYSAGRESMWYSYVQGQSRVMRRGGLGGEWVDVGLPIGWGHDLTQHSYPMMGINNPDNDLQVLLKFDGSSIAYTSDGWSSISYVAPGSGNSMTSLGLMQIYYPFSSDLPGHVALALDKDAPSSPSSKSHVIYVSDNYGSDLYGRCGSDPVDNTEDDSIPYNCGGLVLGGLIFREFISGSQVREAE